MLESSQVLQTPSAWRRQWRHKQTLIVSYHPSIHALELQNRHINPSPQDRTPALTNNPSIQQFMWALLNNPAIFPSLLPWPQASSFLPYVKLHASPNNNPSIYPSFLPYVNATTCRPLLHLRRRCCSRYDHHYFTYLPIVTKVVTVYECTGKYS